MSQTFGLSAVQVRKGQGGDSGGGIGGASGDGDQQNAPKARGRNGKSGKPGANGTFGEKGPDYAASRENVVPQDLDEVISLRANTLTALEEFQKRRLLTLLVIDSLRVIQSSKSASSSLEGAKVNCVSGLSKWNFASDGQEDFSEFVSPGDNAPFVLNLPTIYAF